MKEQRDGRHIESAEGTNLQPPVYRVDSIWPFKLELTFLGTYITLINLLSTFFLFRNNINLQVMIQNIIRQQVLQMVWKQNQHTVN